jgi:hypothetical protein
MAHPFAQVLQNKDIKDKEGAEKNSRPWWMEEKSAIS